MFGLNFKVNTTVKEKITFDRIEISKKKLNVIIDFFNKGELVHSLDTGPVWLTQGDTITLSNFIGEFDGNNK